jgi:hypothetical protein
MELWDILLIAWWLLAAATIIPTSLLAWRLRARDRKAAVSAYLSGQSIGRYRISTVGAAMPLSVYFALFTSGIVLFLGLLGFVWISNWTRLLYLNFELILVWFGAVCLWAGLSPTIHVPSSRWLPPKATSIFMTLFGAVALASGLYMVVGDFAVPPLIVEGRVDGKEDFTRFKRGNTYLIFVNGTRYEATREVYLPIQVGGRIRAELGATSKMILRANTI